MDVRASVRPLAFSGTRPLGGGGGAHPKKAQPRNKVVFDLVSASTAVVCSCALEIRAWGEDTRWITPSRRTRVEERTGVMLDYLYRRSRGHMSIHTRETRLTRPRSFLRAPVLQHLQHLALYQLPSSATTQSANLATPNRHPPNLKHVSNNGCSQVSRSLVATDRSSLDAASGSEWARSGTRPR